MTDEPTPSDIAIQKAAEAQAAIELSRKEQLDEHKDIFLQQYTNIMTTLATLVAGQNNTNAHLSLLNGKVAEHARELTTIMLWKAEAKGFAGAINVGWTTLITLFSGTAGAIIYSLWKH